MPRMSWGGSAVTAHAGRLHHERGRAGPRRRTAAAPGRGRLNDESRRNLRDTFMRSEKEMAAAEPSALAGRSAPSRAGGRTALPPRPRPAGGAGAATASPGVTRRGGGSLRGARRGAAPEATPGERGFSLVGNLDGKISMNCTARLLSGRRGRPLPAACLGRAGPRLPGEREARPLGPLGPPVSTRLQPQALGAG